MWSPLLTVRCLLLFLAWLFWLVCLSSNGCRSKQNIHTVLTVKKGTTFRCQEKPSHNKTMKKKGKANLCRQAGTRPGNRSQNKMKTTTTTTTLDGETDKAAQSLDLACHASFVHRQNGGFDREKCRCLDEKKDEESQPQKLKKKRGNTQKTS